MNVQQRSVLFVVVVTAVAAFFCVAPAVYYVNLWFCYWLE